jgi:HSP20 family molecular chaperone IbpA
LPNEIPPGLDAGPDLEVPKKGEHYFLRVRLPFLKKDEVSLLKRGDELVISIGK